MGSAPDDFMALEYSAGIVELVSRKEDGIAEFMPAWRKRVDRKKMGEEGVNDGLSVGGEVFGRLKRGRPIGKE